MSADSRNLPESARNADLTTYRCITVDDEDIEFSGGFTDLHTESYKRILAGEGFELEENRCAIETVANIRNMTPIGKKGEFHPFLHRLPE